MLGSAQPILDEELCQRGVHSTTATDRAANTATYHAATATDTTAGGFVHKHAHRWEGGELSTNIGGGRRE